MPAAFSLITPKSPLGRRQLLSVCVGCLPSACTHTHTVFSVGVPAHGSRTFDEVIGLDKRPSPRGRRLHGRFFGFNSTNSPLVGKASSSFSKCSFFSSVSLTVSALIKKISGRSRDILNQVSV